MCICISCMFRCLGKLEDDIKSQRVTSGCELPELGAGNWLHSSGRAASAPKYWAISVASYFGIYFNLHILCGYVFCLHVCLCHICAWCTWRPAEGISSAKTGVNRWLWSSLLWMAMWVLGIESKSSGRADNSISSSAISPALGMVFLKWSLVILPRLGFDFWAQVILMPQPPEYLSIWVHDTMSATQQIFKVPFN